jgi:predicted nucleic acid-binding protein
VNLFYWDASALAKRYAPEIGTPLVNRLFANVALDRMMCLSVGTGEVISVFVRKKNAGIITEAAFSQAMVDFRAEVLDSANFKLVAVADSLVFASHPLIERYSLNATDALVLRSALDVANMQRQAGNAVVVLTSDRRLLQAARGEGLQTFSPETDPQVQLDTLISATS